MPYQLAPYALKGGMAIGKYSGTAKKAYLAARLAKSAYGAYSSNRKTTKKAKTKEIKKKNNAPVQHFGDDGHGVTKSRTVTTRRAHEAKAMKDALPYTRRYVGDTPMISSEGTQNWTNLVQFWKCSELQALAAESTSAQNRTYILGASCKVVCTNFTSTPVNMRIHDWVAKVDCYQGEPDDSINKSLGAKYNDAGAGTQYKVPWMSAKEAVEFNHQYKIIGQKDILLDPGETHIHDFYVKIDKYFEGNDFIAGSDPSYVKGISHGILIRTLGTLIRSSTADQFTYATTKVGVVYHVKLDWKTPVGLPTSGGTVGQNTSGVQTTTPRSGFAAEKYMVEDTGVPTINTQV